MNVCSKCYELNAEQGDKETWKWMVLHHRKHSDFPSAIFTEFDIGLDTFKEYDAFKFHIFICVEFCRQS